MYDGVFFLHNYKMIEFLASNYNKHIIHIELLNVLQILSNYEWLCITFISKHLMLVALKIHNYVIEFFLCVLFFLKKSIYL